MRARRPHPSPFQERTFSVPQLVRAAYGDFDVALIVLLRKPWQRMHSAFYAYPHYRNKYGAQAAGEFQWANESLRAFRTCERAFGTDHCALSFESLTRENEEVFYHCDQLIKGLYSVFLKRWRKEHRRILLLRSEQYFAEPRAVLSRSLAFLGLNLPTNDATWTPLLKPAVQLAGTRPVAGTPPLAAQILDILKQFYAQSLDELVLSLRGELDADEWRTWAELNH